MGFVKLQADKGLGRSFAALLPFVEGLYAMGYISEQVYEQHKKKYSQPLVTQKPLQQFLDKREEQLNKTLGMVAVQWNEHPNRKWLEEGMIEEGMTFEPRKTQHGLVFCPKCGTRLTPRKSKRKIEGVHTKGRWKGRPIKKKKIVFTLKCKKCRYKEELDEDKVQVVKVRKKNYMIPAKVVKDSVTGKERVIPEHLVKSGLIRKVILKTD